MGHDSVVGLVRRLGIQMSPDSYFLLELCVMGLVIVVGTPALMLGLYKYIGWIMRNVKS
jgi:hypothetical protein